MFTFGAPAAAPASFSLGASTSADPNMERTLALFRQKEQDERVAAHQRKISQFRSALKHFWEQTEQPPAPSPSLPLEQMKANIAAALSATTSQMRAHFSGLKELEAGALWLVLPEPSKEHCDNILDLLHTTTISVVSFTSDCNGYIVTVEFKKGALAPEPPQQFVFGVAIGFATQGCCVSLRFAIEPLEPQDRWEMML